MLLPPDCPGVPKPRRESFVAGGQIGWAHEDLGEARLGDVDFLQQCRRFYEEAEAFEA